MASETTRLLRRAIALRHSPEARTFWAAVLDALTAGTADPEAAATALLTALRDPGGMVAETVSDWLSTLALSGGAAPDPSWVLTHADPVAVALAGVASEPRETERSGRLRARIRDVMTGALTP